MNTVELIPPQLTSYQKDILFSKARFTITEASTKVGKTHSHMIWLYGKAHEFEIADNKQYWWVAPVYSQAKIAFKRLRKNLRGIGLYNFNETNLIIRCPNGAEIVFKSAEKVDNLYGENVYAAVFDEAPRARPDSWYALRTTLSSTEAPCKLIGNFGGISNWVHKLKDKAKTDPQYAYFRVTCWDAVDEGILSMDEVLQAQKDLPEEIFKILYEAESSEGEGQLIQNESILKLFSNTHISSGVKYITADVARMGKDKTVIGVWDGLRCIEIYTMDVSKVTETAQAIRDLQVKHNVNNANTLVDEDGVGGGVVDILGCEGFVNNSKPLQVGGEDQNFANLKSQCGYKLAEMINQNAIYVLCVEDIEMAITGELEWIRLPKELDATKIRLLTKDEIKRHLGRSPDYSDMMMMRMWWEVDGGSGEYAVGRGRFRRAEREAVKSGESTVELTNVNTTQRSKLRNVSAEQAIGM